MKNIKISEAEWQVMKVIWENEYITLKDIVKHIDNEWSYTTVRTLLNRLLKKGVVGADKSHANFKYYATIKAEDCKSKEAKNFLDRVFDNSIAMLITSLVKKESLSEKEYNDLMRIIDKIERSDDDDMVD